MRSANEEGLSCILFFLVSYLSLQVEKKRKRFKNCLRDGGGTLLVRPPAHTKVSAHTHTHTQIWENGGGGGGGGES